MVTSKLISVIRIGSVYVITTNKDSVFFLWNEKKKLYL